jgi:ankyrin repeat protein
MKDCNLFRLCCDKKWPEMRKYLSSDAAEEEKKSNVMYCTSYGLTCLHKACDRDAPDDIIKTLLDIGGKELVMMTSSYWTVLHTACMNGASYNMIKMLIDVGGKDLVMAKNDYDYTALHYLCGCIKAHTKVAQKIKLILEVGDANLLLSTKIREIATGKGASKRIKKLLTLQSNPNSTTNNDSPSASIVPADNSTPITQSSQEQDTTRSSSTNNDPNIPIRGLDIDQNHQSQLREAKEKAKAIQQDLDQKCIDYSDLEENYQSQLKEAKEQILQIQQDYDQKCADCCQLKAAHANELEESNMKIADLEATVEAQRVTIVALSNEKDDIEKECRDEVDKLTQMCSQRREELQLLRDSRNGEGSKRKHSVEEHQEEEGLVVVSQSRSQSSKRSRLESTADAALVASDRKQPKDGRLEMITCQLLNEKEQHSKLIQQLLDAWKELENVKARNVQLEEDAKLD